MARRAEAVGRRFHRLKLKLGGADSLDVERVRAVRSVTDLPLQVDVNEYWSLEEALENVSSRHERRLRRAAPARRRSGRRAAQGAQRLIYVDEDVHVLADVAKVASARTA